MLWHRRAHRTWFAGRGAGSGPRPAGLQAENAGGKWGWCRPKKDGAARGPVFPFGASGMPAPGKAGACPIPGPAAFSAAPRAGGLRPGLRRLALALALGFLLAVGVTAARQQAAFGAVCAQVRTDTIRLHIRAASDSVLDQTLKLKVRDAVAVLAARMCAGCADAQAARQTLAAGLPRLVLAAQQVLAAAGRPVSVRAGITQDWFDTGHYEGLTLPAGTYTALCLELGAGAGHNWWCCLYPQLCLAAAGARYEAPEENALVTGRYEIRFALVEWWEKRRAG